MFNPESVAIRFKEESRKLGKTRKEIAVALKCDTSVVGSWVHAKNLPSAYYLSVMHDAGLDIIYILTGERHV
jgi:hypothetical protein